MESEMRIPQTILDGLPPPIRSQLARLSPEEQDRFVERYDRRRRLVRLAYILWLMYGWHYAYLGKWGQMILYWLTLGGGLIWAITDAFRLRAMVRARNKDIAAEIIRAILSTAGSENRQEPEPAPGDGISIAEIRDYFACPYMWWFRDTPLALREQELLMRVKGDPSMARPRAVPFDIQRTGCFWLFSIACFIAAVITWILSAALKEAMLRHGVGILVLWLRILSIIPLGFSYAGILSWYRWRQRTPAFTGGTPGDLVYDASASMEPRIFHAARYGITGPLNRVTQYRNRLAITELRSVETPKWLPDQDRMQAVAQALLTETEFGERPKYAYVVYPDRTFEVYTTPAELERLLGAVEIMRTARRTNRIPDVPPAWNLCPACPLTDCPKRIAGKRPESV